MSEKPESAVDRVWEQTPPEDREWIDRMTSRVLGEDGSILTELRRIADALEAFTGKKACDGAKNGKVCVLNPDHVGHHASSDGRLHWLDEE